MTRDYAKTPRSKGKHARRKKAPEHKEKIFRIGLIMLAVLLTLMLVWSLRALEKVDPNVPTNNEERKVSGKSTQEKATAPTESEFSFYDELPKNEENVSDVDAYQKLAEKSQRYRYSLRTGAFKSAKQAENLRAELLLMGFSPNIDRRTDKNGTQWHRVTLGPFLSRSKMYEARGRLLSNNLPAQIIREKLD